ncbi:hypothetical protein GCM10010969_23130 [Saccharibacillus kuerlensis]|uniref:Uncharacterized protein n=1 Tax=Saccharibacillus kuerlensis TaxID=459527 RepID=A0ABQ2L3P7_9BACL|nr:hypothetical protein GCM10010969_23130 [Saccharibacillus kuerlensis]
MLENSEAITIRIDAFAASAERIRRSDTLLAQQLAEMPNHHKPSSELIPISLKGPELGPTL